jgi:hypothetical protein
VLSQLGAAAAEYRHSGDPAALNAPVEAAANTAALGGVTVITQPALAWETISGIPATVSVAARACVPVFLSARNRSGPGPSPDDPFGNVIHPASVTDVHKHPGCVTTSVRPMSPSPSSDAAVRLSANEHPAGARKLPVTVFAPVIVTVIGFPSPCASPCHPPNMNPAAGAALNVTSAPAS